MTPYTRIYNRWQGYNLADCDCKYCIYYGGKRKGEIKALPKSAFAWMKSRKPKSVNAGKETFMEVKINREIRSYTESVFFGLSLRQFIFPSVPAAWLLDCISSSNPM